MESAIYVFETDTVVAYGAVFGSENRGLFVHSAHPSKGVGKSLLKYLLALIDGPAILLVAKSNAPANGLYSNCGFSVVKEFETSYNGVAVLANTMLRE